jgi:hypothetical protein
LAVVPTHSLFAMCNATVAGFPTWLPAPTAQCESYSPTSSICTTSLVQLVVSAYHVGPIILLTLSMSNINFNITEWNFVYKMRIPCVPVSLVLFVHVSIQIEPSLIWRECQHQIFTIICWLKMSVTEILDNIVTKSAKLWVCKDTVSKILSVLIFPFRE